MGGEVAQHWPCFHLAHKGFATGAGRHHEAILNPGSVRRERRPGGCAGSRLNLNLTAFSTFACARSLAEAYGLASRAHRPACGRIGRSSPSHGEGEAFVRLGEGEASSVSTNAKSSSVSAKAKPSSVSANAELRPPASGAILAPSDRWRGMAARSSPATSGKPSLIFASSPSQPNIKMTPNVFYVQNRVSK